MIISLIAAMSENHVIGKGNKLPWHIPDDLKYFKAMTVNKPIIMGRKTFESMGSRPLPQRLNIILTANKDFLASNVTVVHSIEEALKVCGDCEEVMVIGGAKIYEQFLPIASRLYLSIVHENYEGDAFFPEINHAEWKLISEEKGPVFTKTVLNRK